MKHIIYVLFLLALAAGCSKGPHSIIENGHVYDYGKDPYNNRCYCHSDTCPSHSLLVEITERRAHILSAAPSGTILVPWPGEDVRLETDTLNRFMKPVNYMCIRAKVPAKGIAYLRLEADRNWDPTSVLHIHTCATQADTCQLLFDGRGYYNGCNCGGDETIIGLP